MNTELIIHGFLFGWFLAYFEPFQNLIVKPLKSKLPVKLSYISNAMSCFKCLSFWSTLALAIPVFGFYEAVAAGFIAYVTERILNSFKTYL